jgi:hypothetical protein
MTEPRRFPPPWTAEDHYARFIVRITVVKHLRMYVTKNPDPDCCGTGVSSRSLQSVTSLFSSQFP